MTGLGVFVLTATMLISGTLTGPFGVLVGYDPFSVFFRTHFPTFSKTSPGLFIAIQTINLFSLQWNTLESSRIYLTLGIPIMLVCSMYLGCISKIQKMSLHPASLIIYHQLHCINQVIIFVMRNVVGVCLGIGLPFLALGNWIVLKGWNEYPTNLYFVVLGLLLAAYFFLFQTLPLAIQCDEQSRDLCRKWQIMLTDKKDKIQYWSKVLRAQRCVSIYYALTKLDLDTKSNYYSSILDYTINLLLML